MTASPSHCGGKPRQVCATRVFRSQSGEGPYESIGRTFLETTFTDFTVSAGMMYTYVIRGESSRGLTGPSNFAQVVIPEK